jgi:transposase
MHTPEIQMPQVGRRRALYSDEFKRQVRAACLEPGVSAAALALANGLNANLARRWVAESAKSRNTRLPKTATTLVPVHTNPAFIPVKLESEPPAGTILQNDLRIELQQGATTVQVHWPLQASSQCAHWLREVLA